VIRLLPRYYAKPPDERAGDLLRKLADRLIARHGDRWLADALKAPHTSGAAAAFAALGRAKQADQVWDYGTAGKEAQQASPQFQADRSSAGLLYTKYEQSFSLDWASHPRECMQAAGELQQATDRYHYAWLHTQALLLEVVCATWSGDLERADGREREALAEAEREGYAVLSLRAVGFSAGRHAEMGNAAAAWRLNFSGLKSYWAGDYPLLRGYQFYSALSFFAEQNRVAYSAGAWASELVSISTILGQADLRAASLWQRGLSELAAGWSDKAHRDLQQSASINPRIGLAPDMSIQLAASEASQGELDPALERLLAVQPEAEKGVGLLRLQFDAELGLLRLRRREYAVARKLYRDAREIGESSWANAPEPDRPLWARTMASVYRGLAECEIRSGGDPRTAWALWAQYRSRLFARGSAQTATPALPPGEARLSFAELSTSMGVWLETDRGFWFREIPSVESLRGAANSLARGCSSARSPAPVLREDAKELSQKLLGNWDTQLNGMRTVVVESDGPVAPVPWQALVRANGHYWSQDFALRIQAGAAAGAGPSVPITSVERALVVGAPAISGGENLVPLPHAVDEAEKVSSFFPRSSLLTGRSATWERVRAELADTQLFHFAGHGYGGEGGGLLLRGATGGPALFRSADIGHLNLLRCSLVVLAGCSTAAGERGGPGDPQSLVRAFLHAGARDVVAGIWNLDSAGTQILMREFYRAMLAGAPVAESLRQAAAAVRLDDRYAHPYYWAGLEVFSSN
jgi:hypothetical protein